MHGCFHWGKQDPGPCPVDDTPHTACTPESVATRRGEIRVAARPPFVFSTASYPHPVGEPLHAPLIATAVMVRMTAADGALRAGVTYYMRPVQAAAVVARGAGALVTTPARPASPVVPPRPPTKAAPKPSPPSTKRPPPPRRRVVSDDDEGYA